MQWDNILLLEILFCTSVALVFGLVKLPKFFRHRKLARQSPWGFYADQIPKKDPGFISDYDRDFLHNTNAAYGGMKGFGDYGDFTGFGEMGEF